MYFIQKHFLNLSLNYVNEKYNQICIWKCIKANFDNKHLANDVLHYTMLYHKQYKSVKNESTQKQEMSKLEALMPCKLEQSVNIQN